MIHAAGPGDSVLAPCQRRAIEFIEARASGQPIPPDLRVTVNFFPGVRCGDASVLAAISRDGTYRSQFETGLTAGEASGSRHHGRWKWESNLFGGAYDDAAASQRPKYGALNFQRRPAGAAPRFGPATLTLLPDVLNRTTFCYPDSAFQPGTCGVSARCDPLSLAQAATQLSRPPDEDYIDYLETHVHGDLRLDRDVEEIVLDPCYAGTGVERVARDLPFRMRWHHGWSLKVGVLHRFPYYRDVGVIGLASTLARRGRLDAMIIEEALDARCYDAAQVRRVWHYVAWFGAGSHGKLAAASGPEPDCA